MKYRNLLFDDTNPPASDADISAVECELGVSLPDDYKAFLTSCNGGYLDYDILIRFDKGRSEYLSFSSLYKVAPDDDWECNPFELKQARRQQGYPDTGVIPIARDGGSSVLYLDLREGCRVIAFIHGLPEWTGLRQDDAWVVVAGSFEEYLDQLTISDETIDSHITNFEVSESSVNATIEWFDSIGLEWRDKFRRQWNARVSFHQI